MQESEELAAAKSKALFKIYEDLVRDSMRTPGKPPLQAGEASDPEFQQPSMPAVSLPPDTAPAFGPERDEVSS